jgi:hypothetical protein
MIDWRMAKVILADEPHLPWFKVTIQASLADDEAGTQGRQDVRRARGEARRRRLAEARDGMNPSPEVCLFAYRH